jgi:sialic acid synthase
MTRELFVDGTRIADGEDCYVIAEIGHNHQGDLDQCRRLFDQAKSCGANAVKLQKRDNRALFTPEIYDAPYDHPNSYGRTYGEHREFLEFDAAQYRDLFDYAAEIGITFFSTAFDFPSADFLEAFAPPAYKIASGDITNIPLITYVASFGRPMFISTGGAEMADVQRAYDAVMPVNPNVCIMQCTSGYPPAYEELNLSVISAFRDAFPDIPIGYSGHDSGIAMALVAYVMGANVVEKHFTLNRALKGTDHAFSLEHSGISKLVRDLRRARTAMGDGVKRKFPSEDQPLYKMAKKLVAARAIPEGQVIAREDIGIKSPGDGLPPYRIEELIGTTSRRAFATDEAFDESDLG